MVYSKDQPEPVTTDYRGTKIEEGLRVAYNRSGNVVLGTIVSLSRSEYVKGYGSSWDGHRNWRLMFSLVVKDEQGKHSTIKNPRSFVVIKD